MNNSNKAWAILNEEEKAALSLSINHSKSSWQAGEILGKAHYKYLEIQSRARQFFTMFTLYFKETGDRLIPENSEITWDFKEFIECIIEERMGYRETVKQIGRQSDLGHKVARKRDEKLFEYMEWLRKHPQPIHRKLFDLIKEFDRWNNFRVLPENLQEPSAFKRRNKTRLLKHLNNLNNLDSFMINYLKSKKFKADKKTKPIYLPIICEQEDNGYVIIPIKRSELVINYISKELSLYIFEDREKADDYGYLVQRYMSPEGKRDCKLGQQFWPKYRVIIKSAYNYNDVNNIIPRREKLKQAFIDTDKILVSRMESKEGKESYNDAQKRIPKDKIWDL